MKMSYSGVRGEKEDKGIDVMFILVRT